MLSGNLGFNSFNFLTFMVLTFNAIANTNKTRGASNNTNTSIQIHLVFANDAVERGGGEVVVEAFVALKAAGTRGG